MKRTIACIVPLVFLGSNRLLAAPPPNDNRANGTVLSSTTHVVSSGTLEGATDELGEPDTSFYAYFDDEPTVWHRWTAPAGVEWLRIELAGVSIPAVLSIYPSASDDHLALAHSPSPNVLILPVTAGSTYEIRAAVWLEDYYESLYNLGETPDLTYQLTLDAVDSPTTADEHVLRGRGQLALNSLAGITGAEADFSAALALSPTHSEARFLRGLTRLLSLEAAPEFSQLATDLGFSSIDSFRQGGLTVPKDLDGDPIPAVGANSNHAVAWIQNHFIPRLTDVRSDFAAITDGAFVTHLSAAETGLIPVTIDRGDVLALSAATHGIEMLFNLIFTYDLGVSLESLVTLQKTGQLDAEQTLATFTNLLQFAATDHRAQFATELTAMRDGYNAASALILTRPDQTGRLTRKLGEDPDQDAQIRHHLDTTVDSLVGETDWDGTPVNLSQLLTTTASMRDWMPSISSSQAIMGTLPDPTFGGILPGMNRQGADNMLYKFEMLAGMAEYASFFEDYLQGLGLPSGPFEDADGDQISNFGEWLFLTDVITPDVVFQTLERQEISPGQTELTFTFIRPIDAFAGNWPLVVSVSDDLNTWDRTEAKVALIATVDNGDGFSETVTYRLTGIEPNQPNQRFFRIEGVYRP